MIVRCSFIQLQCVRHRARHAGNKVACWEQSEKLAMSLSSISSSFKGEDKEVHKVLLDNRETTYSMAESSVSENNHHEGHLCSPPGQLCSTDGREPELRSGWSEASIRMRTD